MVEAARIWTLQEANASLDKVRELLRIGRTAVAARRDAHAQLEDLQIIHGEAVAKPDHADHAEYARFQAEATRAQDELETVMLQFAALGVEVKDLQEGLIDFPARFGDAMVYLCWRSGEQAVAHFHAVDAGFAGRRPIPGM